MPLFVEHRVVNIGMSLVPSRQEDDGPEVNRVAPKLSEQLALNFNSLHPLGIRRNVHRDRKSTRLNSSHLVISYAVFCLKKKNMNLLPMNTRAAQLAKLKVRQANGYAVSRAGSIHVLLQRPGTSAHSILPQESCRYNDGR